MLKDYRLPPLEDQAPKHAVIFLHGLGDHGDGGLLSIGRFWQRDMPDLECVAPDAPFPYDMAPADFGGRQWFSLKNSASEAMLEGAEQATPLLNAYIDHILTTRKLTPDRLILAGFSQGAMMALYVALRRAQPVAGIIAYSGLLLDGGTIAVTTRARPPVLLVHGQQDDVVHYAAMAEAERKLTALGLEVTTVTCPQTAHGIDDVGVSKGLGFIKKIWPG